MADKRKMADEVICVAGSAMLGLWVIVAAWMFGFAGAVLAVASGVLGACVVVVVQSLED